MTFPVYHDTRHRYQVYRGENPTGSAWHTLQMNLEFREGDKRKYEFAIVKSHILIAGKAPTYVIFSLSTISLLLCFLIAGLIARPSLRSCTVSAIGG